MAVETGALTLEERAQPIVRGLPANIVDQVVEEFIESRNVLQSLYPAWLRYYQLFCGYMPKKRPWRAQIFIPIPFSSTMHGLAMLTEAYYGGSGPMIKVYPREGTDYEGAGVVEAYLDWEDYDMTAFVPHYNAFQDMLLYGPGWVKCWWDWTADRNTLESVSPWNVFPDPAAEGVDDARYIIFRSIRSIEYLREMKAHGLYEISDEEIDAFDRAGLQFRESSDQRLADIGKMWIPYRHHVEILEEWRDGGTNPRTATIVNRQKLVRGRPYNPMPHGFKPVVQVADHAIAHEMMPIGELQVIEKLCEEVYDIRNQRLDSASLALNQVYLANRTAGIDPKTIISRPGQIIWANNTQDALKTLIQNAQQLYLGVQEEQLSRFDIQEATGNWGYAQGQTPLRRETATTVLALQRAAGVRFTLKVRWNEHAAIRRLARLRIANAQAFMAPSKWIRVTGRPLQEPAQPMQIRREQLQGEFDFVPVASSAEPREAKRAQVERILPLLLQHPRVNDEHLINFIADLWIGREKGYLLLSDEEMVQKMAMMAMFSQAQKAGAMGNGAGGGGGIASPDMMDPRAGGMPPLEMIARAGGQRMMGDGLEGME